MFLINQENKDKFAKNVHDWRGWNYDGDCWHWTGSFWMRYRKRLGTSVKLPRVYLVDEETKRVKPFMAYYFSFVVVHLGGDVTKFDNFNVPQQCFMNSEMCVSPHHRFPIERERPRPGKQIQHHGPLTHKE